jgi:ribulose-phosphate 3-epimerase
MNKILRIAPSLLSADFSRLGEEVRAIESAGADLVHFDVMDRPDIELLKSVNPGFGWQKFIPATLAKLREARRRIDAHTAAGGQPIWLEVDGGVKTDNIGEIVATGADTCVAGSAVFGAPDEGGGYSSVMNELRRAACTA